MRRWSRPTTRCCASRGASSSRWSAQLAPDERQRVRPAARPRRPCASASRRMRTASSSSSTCAASSRSRCASAARTLGVLTVLQHDDRRPPLDDFDREIATHLANLAGFALVERALVPSRAGRARRPAVRGAGQPSSSRASEARAIQANDVPRRDRREHPRHGVRQGRRSRSSFVRFNRAGEELLGIPRSELIGKTDFDFFPTDEAEFFVAKDRETLRATAARRYPRGADPDRDAAALAAHQEGADRSTTHGEPRYLLGISHDITERKRDMAALERRARCRRGREPRARGVQLLGRARSARAAARDRRLQPGAARGLRRRSSARSAAATCARVRELGAADGRADRRSVDAVARDARDAAQRRRVDLGELFAHVDRDAAARRTRPRRSRS